MKNLILVFFASLFFVSCKTNPVVYNNLDYTYQKKTPSIHRTYSFEDSESHKPEISVFMMALYNSWDSLSVETQNSFNEALIKSPKKIK